MALDFMQPHRRFNPLTNRYVQVSTHRLDRPWQGEVSDPEPSVPSDDIGCYLCPGNTRKSGEANPEYERAYVFEDDFSPLLRSASACTFMVGDEILGEPQRDLIPQRAAEALRSVSGSVYYRDLEQEAA